MKLRGDRNPPVRRARAVTVLPLLCAFLFVATGPVAGKPPAGIATIYRLEEGSLFQRGCFPPCLCSVMQTGSEGGTIVLRRAGSEGPFDSYKVEEVNFSLHLDGSDLPVTGSGTYRIAGDFIRQQQLTLDLKVGDGPVQRFDSPLLAGADFPRIDATISLRGQFCFDTVIQIHAAPVPMAQLHPYQVLRGSTLARTCSGVCACVPDAPRPVSGSFTLVNLASGPQSGKYSVHQVMLTAASSGAIISRPGSPVTGFGTYIVEGEESALQQMSLRLSVGGQPPASFDSGLVPGGSAFPRIDLPLESSTPCQLTILDLLARPMNPFLTPPETESLPH